MVLGFGFWVQDSEFIVKSLGDMAWWGV